MLSSLQALSPLDGRYRDKIENLSRYFSEMALQRYRVRVEIEWIIFLCNVAKLPRTRVLKSQEVKFLRDFYENFDQNSAQMIKDIEKTTNHDVKAVEYFIREQMKGGPAESLSPFVHFACTSEDINNLSYALMMSDAGREEYMPVLGATVEQILVMAREYKSFSMLSRTHGQSASPTTMGKEFLNIFHRLDQQIKSLRRIPFWGKMNGAVGNFNAHMVAYPKINWKDLSQKFVQSLGLEPNLYTTQIEPHDFMAEIFDAVRRINTVLIDFSRDMWTYISMNYFVQQISKGEVGSSTMPHKINPIDFENAEGNFGLANALFEHFSQKLPISRMQRDLTDSTVLRNIGVAIGYSLLGYKSLLKGLSKVRIHPESMLKDLDNHWEVLSEAIQTVLRKYNVSDAYEQMKKVTQGKHMTRDLYKKIVRDLPLLEEEIDHLLKLTPETYIGLAEKLVSDFKL